jgi:uncharacterized protein
MAVNRYETLDAARVDASASKDLPNGWLKADAFITRTGVFEYKNADGSVRRELRLPEEVFHPDSLASFEMVPLTREHPPVVLDSANTADHAPIGHVGDTVRKDGAFVRARIMVTDADAVREIKEGRRVQLSCGYVCDLEETSGTFNGKPYDCIQRNIRGNHVALVARGRAGPEVRVKLDTADAIMVNGESEDSCNSRAEGSPSMTKYRIDGVEFEVSESAAQALAKAEAAKDAEVAALKAAAEKSKARTDALEAEVKSLKEAAAPEKIRETIKARVELERKAAQFLPAETKFDTMDDDAVRVAVIKALAPDVDLSGKSPAYVEARFDAEVARGKPATKSDAVVVRADDFQAPNLAAIKAKFAEASRNAHRTAKK